MIVGKRVSHDPTPILQSPVRRSQPLPPCDPCRSSPSWPGKRGSEELDGSVDLILQPLDLFYDERSVYRYSTIYIYIDIDIM